TMASVTNHIDKDILVVMLPVRYGELTGFDHCLRVITIHVQHRCLQHRSYAGAIVCRPGIVKVCSETYLVVDNKVYGTPCAIAWQLAHLQQFINYSLTCNGSITMD